MDSWYCIALLGLGKFSHTKHVNIASYHIKLISISAISVKAVQFQPYLQWIIGARVSGFPLSWKVRVREQPTISGEM